MGEDADRQELNVSCVRALYRTWKNLKPQHRPLYPSRLMRILGDWYQYPIPDYLIGADAKQLADDVDAAFDRFAEAAAMLAGTLPSSGGWHVLPRLLEERLPVEGDKDKSFRLLLDTEAFIERFSALPQLQKRSGLRGAPLKNSDVRVMVQVICWYVARIEKMPIKSGFKDDTGEPTSRVARMIHATCVAIGLDVPPKQIKTHLDAVKKLQINRFEFWDLMSVLPAP